MIKTGKELAAAALGVANNYKTLYVMGCFGAPLTGSNVSRYCKNHSYNKQAERTAMIKARADKKPPYYGFDCVCLIKALLWGWNGNANKTYGGAVYESNGVPDIDDSQMIKVCKDVSTNFSKIEVGEVVWMKGHIGIYVGDGLVVEASPKWGNNVQITACKPAIPGRHYRRWTKHGKLPYVDYPVENVDNSRTPQVGDTVNFTGNRHYVSENSGTGKKCKPGKATVTKVSTLKNCAHPYHLVKVKGGGSTVYGWVDAKDIEAAQAKSIDELAQEVIDGKWGNGAKRKKALGDLYSAVQARVNELLKK